jgi:hypothetical protein
MSYAYLSRFQTEEDADLTPLISIQFLTKARRCVRVPNLAEKAIIHASGDLRGRPFFARHMAKSGQCQPRNRLRRGKFRSIRQETMAYPLLKVFK